MMISGMFPLFGRVSVGAIGIAIIISVSGLSSNTALLVPPPPRRYFASCIPGLENVLAKEIEQIGGHNLEIGRSGVQFTEAPSKTYDDDDFDTLTGTTKDMTVGLRCLLWVRTCHRVMELIATTQQEGDEYYNQPVYNKNDLHEFIQKSCNVKSMLGDGKGKMLTFAVKVTVGLDKNSKNLPKELCHTHFTALTVKNALVDKCRNEREDGARPDVNIENPDVPLIVALRAASVDDGGAGGAHVSVYRSLNGFDSLHRRGYRTATDVSDDNTNAIHKAAMKESMGSGLLYECGWHLLIAQAKKDGLPALLIDPMTGSGTFCIEAALIAADVAPGLIRMRSAANNNNTDLLLPAALRWRSSDMELWKRLCEEARVREKKGRSWLSGRHPVTGQRNCRILGNELHVKAYKLALQGGQRANFTNSTIEFHRGNCQEWKISDQIVEGRTIVVSNPPWGLRLTDDVEESWMALKTFLREECVGAEAWVLSGNKNVTRLLKMKKTRSVPLTTAAENLRWLQYHIFKSSANFTTPSTNNHSIEII